VLGCLKDAIPNLSRSALHRCLQAFWPPLHNGQPAPAGAPLWAGKHLDQIRQTRTIANLKRRIERLGYPIALQRRFTFVFTRSTALGSILSRVSYRRSRTPVLHIRVASKQELKDRILAAPMTTILILPSPPGPTNSKNRRDMSQSWEAVY
jgi:hypothetical protein